MQNIPTSLSLRICYMRERAAAIYTDGPSYATPLAAGMDLRACLEAEEYTIVAGQRALIPSGIGTQPMTEHVAGFVYSRSGLGAKHGIVVAQGVGVIDNDYRGEIFVMLLNTSASDYTVRHGERIAQLVYQPIVRAHIDVCQTLDSTKRGDGGFGHTGNT